MATATIASGLPDHAVGQPLFHLDELLHLGFQEAGHRDARPLGHRLGDVLFVDFFLQHALALLELRELRVLCLELAVQLDQRPVLELGGLLEIAAALGVLDGRPCGLRLFLDLD